MVAYLFSWALETNTHSPTTQQKLKQLKRQSNCEQESEVVKEKLKQTYAPAM
jgi:hypothetical protein